MAAPPLEIVQAYWLGPRAGCVLLNRNREDGEEIPALVLDPPTLRLRDVRPAERDFLARFCGYYERADGRIVFSLDPRRHPQIDFTRNPVQVAGPFNAWGADGPAEAWRLRPVPAPDGGARWECAVDRDRLRGGSQGVPFKFLAADWQWLSVPPSAPNRIADPARNVNYLWEPGRTGRHVLRFDAANGRGLAGRHRIRLAGAGPEAGQPVTPGLSFFDLATPRPLGAFVERPGTGKAVTVFRLFAPSAISAAVEVCAAVDTGEGEIHRLRLQDDELTWEVRIPGDLGGCYYYLRVRTDPDDPDEPGARLLDPWALVAAGPAGPGLILDRASLPRPRAGGGFHPPFWHDLVVLEGHVRDLTARAPIALTPEERLGFRGLTRWLADDGSYLRELGVNALELLPVTQSDATARENYHWGYMPTSFFSPNAHYATAPERGSQIEEFGALVAECHRRGLAVILDVVYNHVGIPAALLAIDRTYYFHLEADGRLADWSGCGNTLRADAAMARRLIIESLVHWVETFDVDGFRFDLAELLTVEGLREIELALKAVKPAIILLAEPWSFRGSLAWNLRSIGVSFWNDGFREFVAAYVAGAGDAEGVRYYLKGSLDHASAWPAQSVNYVESHDDRCWLDRITENRQHDGRQPTANDVHRTHLALAMVLCAIGIPMLAAGQDFLRSKGGRSNTYRNGDVNALDYGRLQRFGLTHFYCRQWIAFRRSAWGELLRLWERPGPGYVRLYAPDGGTAAAILFNADRSRGGRQILFAVNPQPHDVELKVEDLPSEGWQELADRANFNFHGLFNARLLVHERRLRLGPIDCGLWVRSG